MGKRNRNQLSFKAKWDSRSRNWYGPGWKETRRAHGKRKRQYECRGCGRLAEPCPNPYHVYGCFGRVCRHCSITGRCGSCQFPIGLPK